LAWAAVPRQGDRRPAGGLPAASRRADGVNVLHGRRTDGGTISSGRSLCRQCRSSPMLGRSPTAGATGKAAMSVEPPSSSGLGHRPFKAAARVRIPLGARWVRPGTTHGPVEQLGVLATLSRWRSRVQIPSGPLSSAPGVSRVEEPWPARSGSSVGTSVRLKSGRSAVRPRP
jgi:hypothetical protein